MRDNQTGAAGGRWRPFRALPAYLGGKRRLCRLILALLAKAVPQDRWPGLTFVDPFLGGGSVSLFAKAQGFHALCNDLALRAAAVGRALVANNTVVLEPADLAALLKKPSGKYRRRAEERHSPSVFPRGHAVLLDHALHNLRAFAEPKRSLAILLLVKWALRVQPMSMLRGTDARAAFEGDLDRVSPRRLGHYLNGRRLLTPEAWLALADEVSSGVFPGKGEAHQQDALVFLQSARGVSSTWTRPTLVPRATSASTRCWTTFWRERHGRPAPSRAPRMCYQHCSKHADTSRCG